MSSDQTATKQNCQCNHPPKPQRPACTPPPPPPQYPHRPNTNYYCNGNYLHGGAFIQNDFPYYNGPNPEFRPPRPTYDGIPSQYPYHKHCHGPYIVGPHKPPYDQSVPPHGGDFPNVLNIETRLRICVDVTIYCVNEEDDITITLETGKIYNCAYLSEHGLEQITGTLVNIDSRIPTEAVRYIGESNEVTDFAYIVLDTSTIGTSDVRKVFIQSIRYLEEYKEENPDGDDDGSNENKGPATGITIPSASKDELGLVKVGQGLTIDKDGTLNVDIESTAEKAANIIEKDMIEPTDGEIDNLFKTSEKSEE